MRSASGPDAAACPPEHRFSDQHRRARPAVEALVAFIDAPRQVFGVEPICRVLTSRGLKIATSIYYAARNRTPSDRSVRDGELKTQISRVHADNFSVYGVRKVWRQLHREGIPVARCTVARLMRDLGLEGVRRGKKIRTTVRDDGQDRNGDLLRRDFTASRPNERWVADLTYVATCSGIVYVAFVVDVFSRAIVGWSAATSKRAKLVLDALDMALWRRDRAGAPAGPGLVHHSDAGSQGEFNWSSQHPDVGGVRRGHGGLEFEDQRCSGGSASAVAG
ncbi:IS3 family transposase [Streptomyces avermitilis]|uniref:IS3 family transposase n=1 Tax=Streptomyces avermitilis TaxID=33903 RepID=UPI0036C0F1A1